MAKLPLPSSVDKRFDVEIRIAVTKEGSDKPMSETIQLYRNMDYVQMQITQGMAIRAVAEALIGAGDAVVAEITEAAASQVAEPPEAVKYK